MPPVSRASRKDHNISLDIAQAQVWAGWGIALIIGAITTLVSIRKATWLFSLCVSTSSIMMMLGAWYKLHTTLSQLRNEGNSADDTRTGAERDYWSKKKWVFLDGKSDRFAGHDRCAILIYTVLALMTLVGIVFYFSSMPTALARDVVTFFMLAIISLLAGWSVQSARFYIQRVNFRIKYE